jgi:hypothetical protein
MRFAGGVTRTTFENLKLDIRRLAKRTGLRLSKFQLTRAGGKKTRRAKKK